MKRVAASQSRGRKRSKLPVVEKKWYEKLTRTQYLGAATIAALLVLLVVLQRGDKVVDNKNPAKVKVSTPARTVAQTQGGQDDEDAASANRPPVLASVALLPSVALPGTPLKVEAKMSDPDGDAVSLSYLWKKNGAVVEGEEDESFDTTGLKKGDLITVSVTPHDGKEPGKVLESNGIVIQNRPPELTSQPSAGITSGLFQYQAKATDPDNDILVFTLEEAPPGMTIDGSTGFVQWTVPEGLQGKQQVRVAVSDGTATAFQVFNLNLESKREP